MWFDVNELLENHIIIGRIMWLDVNELLKNHVTIVDTINGKVINKCLMRNYSYL